MVTVALMGSNHDYLNWYGRDCWKTTFHLVEKTVRSASSTPDWLFPISSCTQEIAAIVAMLQVENVFLQSGHHQSGKARMAKRKFEVKEGDLLTLLNVYRFKPFFFISRFYPLSSSWSFNRSWTRWLASPLELWQHSGLVFWSLVNGCLSNTPKI